MSDRMRSDEPQEVLMKALIATLSVLVACGVFLLAFRVGDAIAILQSGAWEGILLYDTWALHFAAYAALAMFVAGFVVGVLVKRGILLMVLVVMISLSGLLAIFWYRTFTLYPKDYWVACVCAPELAVPLGALTAYRLRFSRFSAAPTLRLRRLRTWLSRIAVAALSIIGAIVILGPMGQPASWRWLVSAMAASALVVCLVRFKRL